MANPPPPPHLTPTLCFSPSTLRAFLASSRSQIDDTISTHLNALLTPSSTSPFDPSSTTSSLPARRGAQPRQIPSDSCHTFMEQVLFPTWSSRDEVLHYCTSVAASPDPDDPDLKNIQEYNEAGARRTVNERLDPYSGRFFPREARTERLAELLRNEEAVEGIVRSRVWGVIANRCGGVEGARWDEALGKWRVEQGTGRKGTL